MALPPTTSSLHLEMTVLNNGTGNGNRILKPETVALMSAKTTSANSTRPRWPNGVRRPAGNDIDFLPGIDKKCRPQLHA